MNYTVRPGDTLSSIAARFGVPVQDLINVNNIPYPYHIYVGQVLYIPIRPTQAPTSDFERRLERLEDRVDSLRDDYTQLDDRVDDLQNRLNYLQNRVNRLENMIEPRPRTTPRATPRPTPTPRRT